MNVPTAKQWTSSRAAPGLRYEVEREGRQREDRPLREQGPKAP